MDRAARLAEVIEALERRFGAGVVYRLSNARPRIGERAVSTGSLGLDHATGIGGVPRGAVSLFEGPESSGKTTLAYHVLANSQRGGGLAAFVDAEQSIDPAELRVCGVDFGDLVLAQPIDSVEALEIVAMLAHSAALDSIVVSSLARPLPPGALAPAARRIGASLAGAPTALLLVGNSRPAARFPSASLAVRFSLLRLIGRPGGDVVGLRVRATVEKNRLGRPGGSAEVELHDGRGLHREAELLDLGVALGLVDLTSLGAVFGAALLGFGRPRALATLAADRTLADRLAAAIRQALAAASPGARVEPRDLMLS